MDMIAIPVENTDRSQRGSSKTDTLFKRIRNGGMFRELVPMEASNGLPIPLRKGNVVYAILPFYTYTPADPQQGNKIVLFPPFVSITVNWTTKVPVEYVDFRFRSPAPELNWEQAAGLFPPAGMENMSVREYEQQKRELMVMYDELFETLAQQGSFSPDWNERFSRLLRLMLEPCLEPYYRALSPKFFENFL
jgi:hypothetical protein